MHLEYHSGLEKLIWVVTNDEPKFTKMHLSCKEVAMNGLKKKHLECHSGLEKYIWVFTNDEPNAHEISRKCILKCKEVAINGLKMHLGSHK